MYFNLVSFVHANGLDLNPVLFGCIMSGGTCFSNTGIDIVDKIFGGGKEDLSSYESCQGRTSIYDPIAGKRECRNKKIAFYINHHDDIRNYWASCKLETPTINGRCNVQQITDWKENLLSNRLRMYGEKFVGYPGYFDCSPKQLEIYKKFSIGCP